jgi:hypothetical protein
MKTYRLKHLPTGLYYIPSRKVVVKKENKRDFVKSNLSKNGKVYLKKPTLKYIGPTFYNHTKLILQEHEYSRYVYHKPTLDSFIETEWMIEEND